MSPRDSSRETAEDTRRPVLPPEQQDALRRAVRLEWTTLAVMAVTVAVVGLTTGQSQAMKAAWIEDCLSLLPPIAFLVASRRIRRPSDRDHPYGHHRSIGVAHLVAAVALLVMGTFLVVDSATGLLTAEKPPIGIMVLFGQPLWSGWVMIAVMAASGVAPVVLGRKKIALARTLHDKVLYADADMNKADWSTAVATIVGLVGIGLGLWWLDAVAALVVAASIISDGVKNLRAAVRGLTDARARSYDEKEPHPLTGQVEEHALGVRWVADAAARVRDEGHVFHVELFVVPRPGQDPPAVELAGLRDSVRELDWKLHDVVVALVPEVPGFQAPR
ncbi:cation transporter [Auraticoccus sp. F435]|uniref:Cation transporter n=1 Tax=Auraticoccus cholistanensis TaxID=2656650 RepID=A0A6A9UVG4_9ACTN|nr:cation diffusion facilitator family transporter [Auraticoccus cholistanensis]MVA76678.1 cation transporter [Auraticoccus cholistanensis]